VFDLSWQFYGVNNGTAVTFGNKSEGKFGCYWVDEGKVVGAFLESGSDDQNAAIKALARVAPEAPEDLGSQGIDFALKATANVTI